MIVILTVIKKLPYSISEVLIMFMFLCIHCFSGIILGKRLEFILLGLVSPFAVKMEKHVHLTLYFIAEDFW